MSKLEEIFKRIDTYRDEVIQIQANLTSRVALGPDNGGLGEHEKAGYVKELLKALGPEKLEELNAPDERARDGYRPNLIARWGDDRIDQTIWVLSHSDIVPPGDLSLWKSNPYKITVEGDRIIGRGVEDNQHGFISPYLALKAVLDSGKKLKKPVGLAIVADEETGSAYGLSYILENNGGLFKRDDLIIVPDGGNEDGTMIEVAEKTMLWVKFTVTGKQCHASTPNKGKNSLFGAAKLILALDELKRQFNISDKLFSPPVSTFESTKMEANVPNINTIPGKNSFFIDCRVLPQYGADNILAAIKGIASRVSDELDLEIKLETAYRQDATESTSPDASVVKALSAGIKRVTGRDGKPMGIGGGTVAAFFREAGFPAAVWSTVSETAHQPNEYCLISNILTDAKVFACLFMNE
ncbi:MAG TPA: diaminopimelate aminotransferase [Desulfobacteraceae bacterium]|nr:diaminopimelate aminotransferase [Desulfobacteraceae bacterium]